ncbi:MAG: tyrosine-type recombinase/integrase [Clostridium sp.]|jgi:integrase|nr:tyrosine-type recombinase/integrase [Clostridium sp.]
MNNFKSGFASKIDSMLEFRTARGFKNQNHLANLHRFDDFCFENYPEATKLTAEIVYDWIDVQTILGSRMLNDRACTIRQFGLYLSAVDENAFVLTEKFRTNLSYTIAYNFTDAELSALFASIDKISADAREPYLNVIAPVLFRLTYTCGLRPNEVRELLCENVDLKSGVITILNTKKHRDRVVVMSDDMLKMCRRYDSKRAVFANHNPYFFPSNNGGSFKSDRLQSILIKAWTKAVCSKNCPLPPRIRVYDLRHRFASSCLNNWLDEGKDLMSMLPYLRAYMGHSSLNETAYYIHILLDNLLKSSAIEWDKFNAMFPEVPER